MMDMERLDSGAGKGDRAGEAKGVRPPPGQLSMCALNEMHLIRYTELGIHDHGALIDRGKSLSLIARRSETAFYRPSGRSI